MLLAWLRSLSRIAPNYSRTTGRDMSPGPFGTTCTWWASGTSWLRPFIPQTNGKLERYQQTAKQEVNQVLYELPSQLERAIAGFVDYYNFHRYHKALGDVTPADVLYGRREQILQRRKEV